MALVAGIILPFWNIPLVLRVIKRRSSEDISISWALGVWICMLLMAPSAFVSEDIVWRIFNIINTVIFSIVVIIVLKYRKKRT
jgi:uncharacterized protein with PQ loop repeat